MTSSGKRTRSACSVRARSSHSATRAVLPSMSPTTLLICASASLICPTDMGQGAPPLEVEEHGDEEDGEREPADERRGPLLPDEAEHRGGGERADQQPAERVGPQTHTATSMEVVIADRFRGPVGSGNGGYSAGVIAAAAGGGE